MENKDKEKEKVKEPYSPENTPTPPQQIDPSIRNERNEKPGDDKTRKASSPEKENKEGSGKKLGDPTEITDETTI